DRADSLRHFAAVRAPDNRGHQGISQAVFDYIRHYYHEHSKPSPSCKDQRSCWVCQTVGDDKRTLVNETRRFFESSLLVMWLEFDDEQQHLEEQWRQNEHPQGGQLQQPPSMRVSLSTFMPEYIKHHRLAHHQLQVFREHREVVKAGQEGKVVISCDWSEKLTVERSVEIMSEHWHAQQIGILVACAYFRNKEGAYKEHTVYVMTDGKEQSAAITQAAVNQVVCLENRLLVPIVTYCAKKKITGVYQALHPKALDGPIFDQKKDDKHWDDECPTLMCSFAPDNVKQLCTLGKKLGMKIMNEYCKAKGFMCQPAPCVLTYGTWCWSIWMSRQGAIELAATADRAALAQTCFQPSANTHAQLSR
ncbi:hypothetical protein QJQ45_018686, partial [Haematococcus lacustris]